MLCSITTAMRSKRWDQTRLAVRRARTLIGHLEEQQIGELFDVVAIAHALVAQDVAVVPELLDEGGSVHMLISLHHVEEAADRDESVPERQGALLPRPHHGSIHFDGDRNWCETRHHRQIAPAFARPLARQSPAPLFAISSSKILATGRAAAELPVRRWKKLATVRSHGARLLFWRGARACRVHLQRLQT